MFEIELFSDAAVIVKRRQDWRDDTGKPLFSR